MAEPRDAPDLEEGLSRNAGQRGPERRRGWRGVEAEWCERRSGHGVLTNSLPREAPACFPGEEVMLSGQYSPQLVRRRRQSPLQSNQYVRNCRAQTADFGIKLREL